MWGKILRKAVSDDGRCEGEKDGGRGRQDTAECGGRVDRGDQEGEESARSEVRRGGAAQMSKLGFKWARREGRRDVHCSGDREKEMKLG